MGQEKLLRSTLLKHKKEEKLFPYTHTYPFTYGPYRNSLLLNDSFSGCFTKQAIGSVEAIASPLKLSQFKEYQCSQKSQSCCYFQISSSRCHLKQWYCKHTEKKEQQTLPEPPCPAYPQYLQPLNHTDKNTDDAGSTCISPTVGTCLSSWYVYRCAVLP